MFKNFFKQRIHVVLNTAVSGHITLSTNGKIIYDDVISDFINSEAIRPLSLEGNPTSEINLLSIYINFNTGKLTLHKGRGMGFWYQSQFDVTNLNVFR